jgi:hypothetical protein
MQRDLAESGTMDWGGLVVREPSGMGGARRPSGGVRSLPSDGLDRGAGPPGAPDSDGLHDQESREDWK